MKKSLAIVIMAIVLVAIASVASAKMAPTSVNYNINTTLYTR